VRPPADDPTSKLGTSMFPASAGSPVRHAGRSAPGVIAIEVQGYRPLAISRAGQRLVKMRHSPSVRTWTIGQRIAPLWGAHV
jgi:hypothetical protein